MNAKEQSGVANCPEDDGRRDRHQNDLPSLLGLQPMVEVEGNSDCDTCGYARVATRVTVLILAVKGLDGGALDPERPGLMIYCFQNACKREHSHCCTKVVYAAASLLNEHVSDQSGRKNDSYQYVSRVEVPCAFRELARILLYLRNKRLGLFEEGSP